MSDPGESTSETGVVRIRLGDDEPWAGLVLPESEATGALSEWRGGASLAPED